MIKCYLEEYIKLSIEM